MPEKVEVYTTPTCPHCKEVKNFLDQNNIEYTEHNVQENLEKAKEMIKETGQRGVPVTKINEEIVVGYNKDKLKELLDLQEEVEK